MNEPISPWSSELFVFRGKNIQETKQVMAQLAKLLDSTKKPALKDIAYSLAQANDLDVQVAIVTSNLDELSDKIALALEDKQDPSLFYRQPIQGKLAFLFSGQGSQRVNMALDLMVAIPQMRTMMEQHPNYMAIAYPQASFDDAKQKQQLAAITDTRNAQPLLGIVDLAIANYLSYLGIKPDMLAGHSYGELAALCFGGAFAQEDLVKLSVARAQSIMDSVGDDPGKMAAVTNLSEANLTEMLKDESEVWAVNYNSLKQIVVAGTTASIEAFVQKCKVAKVNCKPIAVAAAFHSPLIAQSEQRFAAALKGVSFKEPRISVWSNTTAELYPTKAKEIRARLSKQLVSPVLWTRQLQKMYEDGARIFIETGPGKVLTGLVERTLAKDVLTIATENKGGSGLNHLLKALAKYLSGGRSFDLSKLFEGRKAKLCDLNTTK